MINYFNKRKLKLNSKFPYPFKPSKSIDEQEEEVEEEEDEVIMKKESDTILSYETKENEVERNLRYF